MNPSLSYSSEVLPVTLPVRGNVAQSVARSAAQSDDRQQDAFASTQKRLFKGRFEIVRRLGRGGFGTTYLARDMRPEGSHAAQPLPCVIKQMTYSSKVTNEGDRASATLKLERTKRRFQREARMMARLGRHNQMPRLLDHFIEGDRFYLVQEHIPGLTLGQELRRGGIQNEFQVKAFLREMIPVVRHIHRQNLLHLDIKPANIIRRRSDQKLVLIDFGGVRRYPDEGSVTRRAASKERCAGTIGFSPVEQLSGQPTPASDIYALGVTCLYLLTGISPLDFATSPNGQNLRWQESVNVSRHFTQVLEKMLAPEAKRRFQTLDELERALDLEPHFDELKDCMTTATDVAEVFAQPEACLLELPTDTGSQNHIHRQARSIRRWQQRRRQYKSFTPQ